MTKIIIGIHGLGNKAPEQILKIWWEASIKEGLARIGKPHKNLPFELIYWADINYERPLDETCTDKSDPYYIGEKYKPSESPVNTKPNKLRKTVLDILEKQTDKIILNDDLSINFSFITDIVLRKFFIDLQNYYDGIYTDANGKIYRMKDIIRNRINSILTKHKNSEIMLVCHSMGTIIAYDVLTFFFPEYKIETFVTMGSPLGVPAVMSKNASERGLIGYKNSKLQTPPVVTRAWKNFSDIEDPIAANYDLGDDYDPNENGIGTDDFIVQNDYEYNGKKNPHKSFGYLRTEEFAKEVFEFLSYEDDKPVGRIWKGIKIFWDGIMSKFQK